MNGLAQNEYFLFLCLELIEDSVFFSISISQRENASVRIKTRLLKLTQTMK